MTRTLSVEPVCFDPVTRLWRVSSYDDIRPVLSDPDTFRPDNALTAVMQLSPAALRVLARAGFSLPPMLANNGDASHAPLRRLTAQFFSAERVEQALPMMRSLAESAASAVRHSLDRAPEVDLVGAVTAELPCRVLLHVLGLAADDSVDVQTLLGWSQASLKLFWGWPSPDEQLALAAHAADFYRWITERLGAGSVGEPSLFGAVNAHRDGDGTPLSRRQAASLCYFLLVAGHQTTSQLMAIALRRGIGDPDLWRRLSDSAAGPVVAEEFIEQVLRTQPPVTTWRRVLSRPAVVGGVALSAGSQLLLQLAPNCATESADATGCPITPVAQPKGPHLAFGYGRHFCLGATLARTEAAIVLTTLARDVPGMHLCDDPAAPQLRLLSFAAPIRVLVTASRTGVAARSRR